MIKETESYAPAADGPVQITELLNRRRLSETVFEIELSRPKSFNFVAGQTICFRHASVKRYYSLLSAPDDPTLKLCVYNVPQGRFSPILAEAKVGRQFKFSGPHGYFTFKRSSRPAVFVSSGTGIAPFVSMARAGVTDFTLLHEVMSADDLYYRRLFEKVAANYVACLLKAADPALAPTGAFQGNAAGYLTKNLPSGSYDFYLCGEREMIREVTLLVDERFAGSYVYTEVFY